MDAAAKREEVIKSLFLGWGRLKQGCIPVSAIVNSRGRQRERSTGARVTDVILTRAFTVILLQKR